MKKKIRSFFKKSLLLLAAGFVCVLSIGFANSSSAKASTTSSDLAYSRGTFFDNGWNNLYGNFYYKGSSYEFIVSFKYNSRTGKVSGATYKAISYGSGSVQKITSMTISSDERYITIKGNRLHISVSLNSYGSYSGSMTRGNHSGSCELYIDDCGDGCC